MTGYELRVMAMLSVVAWTALASPSASGAEEASTARAERLRAEATKALAAGDFDRARQKFEEVLTILPGDAPAARDAARAAEAAGRFQYAADALEEAHDFDEHHADPELHYLRGEALYALNHVDEARREHRIAELEMALRPIG